MLLLTFKDAHTAAAKPAKQCTSMVIAPGFGCPVTSSAEHGKAAPKPHKT
jgi:hypothetical protein